MGRADRLFQIIHLLRRERFATANRLAEVLGVSTRTVERGWRAARAWLRDRLAAEGLG